MAASVAMAVPQTPMKWILELLNGGLFNDQTRMRGSDDSASDAKRKRQRWAGGVARRKTDQHRPWKVAEQIGHRASRRRFARRLDTPDKLADHHSCGVFQQPRLA